MNKWHRQAVSATVGCILSIPVIASMGPLRPEGLVIGWVLTYVVLTVINRNEPTKPKT